MQQHLRLQPLYRNACYIRRAADEIDRYFAVFTALFYQVVLHCSCLFKILPDLARQCLYCCTEAADERNAFGPRAKAAFLSSAEHQRRQVYLTAQVQSANAFGCVYLMTAQRDHIRIQFFYRHGQLHKALNAVAVGQRLRILFHYHRKCSADIEHSSRFVVYEHHAHEERILVYCIEHGFRAYLSVLVG